MTAVRLLDPSGGVVDELILTGIGHWLRRRSAPEFPLLGSLDNVSYDVFSASDMPELLREVALIASEPRTADEAVEVARLTELARRCAVERGLSLGITPFA